MLVRGRRRRSGSGTTDPAAPRPAPRLPAPGQGYTTRVESRTATGTVGDRYRIRGLLGEGGMARVFDAFDDRLERPVAVKILRPATEALPGMRKRFQQEARLAARLIHPHIVAVLDYGEDDALSYLVMERLPGTTLRDEIARGPLTTSRVMLVITEALSALAAAHKFGVLHRDVKPSNILLQDDGHTKITDFGIAKSVDIRTGAEGVTEDMTLTGVVLGTPGYLAPERRSGLPATAQSDLFSVGAVMVEALTGRRAAPGAIPTEELPPPFRDIARRALAAGPNERFGSAVEMLHALRPPRPTAVAAPQATAQSMAPRPAVTLPVPVAEPATVRGPTKPAEGPRPHRPAPSPTRVRRRRMVWAGATAAALIALLLLLLTGSSQPTGPTAAATSHHVAHTDSEAKAIRALASSLAGTGLPGDRALAGDLGATASQQPGTARVAAAGNALSLAQVLLAGGGITPAQYQDVVNTLQPTGASVPTTTHPPPPPRPRPPRSRPHRRRRSTVRTTATAATAAAGRRRQDEFRLDRGLQPKAFRMD